VLLLLPAVLLLSEIDNWAVELRSSPEDAEEPAPRSWYYQVALVEIVVGPMLHELFFRGLLQPWLVRVFGAERGVPIMALLNAIASSESALEATETGYEVGTRNIVDVLQAQQRLYSSQFDYADSRYNYVTDLMRLQQTAGILEEQHLTELNQFADQTDTVTRKASLRNRSANPGSQ